MSHLITPHGGVLVDLMADDGRKEVLKDLSLHIPSIVLSERQMCDLELLMNGSFSPLTGFMTHPDYEAVLDRMRLQDNTVWPIPICLDVTELEAGRLEAGQSAALRDPEGFMLGVMHIEEIWPIDKQREALAVYGTADADHPGVYQLFHQTGSHYVGGKVEGVNMPLHFDFKQLRLTPLEVRNACLKLGWRRLVGFHTRNILHRAQFEMTLGAMRESRANLLFQPTVGPVRPGDIDYYTRVRCYQKTAHHYPPNMMLLSLLPLAVRMAGPRSALWHALIRKNYGCTHFIVGRDHGGPGLDNAGRPFYEPYASRELLEKFKDELGIHIIPFEEMVYTPEKEKYVPRSEIKGNVGYKTLSGTELVKLVRAGLEIPAWFTFEEVVEELRNAYPPRHKQGFTVFFTGLSGSGKSTVAQVLISRFLEIGDRPVTLLDGDIVRRHLSSELGFSKEDRDINVRRIGFVASEITKNRGIAVCAPIAPYRLTRRQVREMIEQYGGFIEVHVATSLEVCEKRDRKGIYAKARAGLIKGFTGIDDPYEDPERPELRIDTTEITPDEAAQEVLLELQREGYIK
ncbi:Sulfate adenylyltransferase [uncultured Desulfobacterium sp.]|uniref:Adenylyl-sulfate kinase n=1 Tax=uncultured Desulfobacterium sp. TaxID=201089 RepID=A0A445N3K3_9BACT|nr:Sulfate adenylyltransferase [uncultured Desulfobacterium sp.]